MAGEHGVQPAAGVAELVLEDDAVVVQLGLVEEELQRHEAVLPAAYLVGDGLWPIWVVYSARSFSAIRCICASARNCSVVPA